MNMQKVRITREDLQKHLQEQTEFLMILADAYDGGKIFVAKQIATVVRLLLSDTKNCVSLLSQLDLKKKLFFDSSTQIEEKEEGVKRMTAFAGLVSIGIGPKTHYIPYLDEVPDGVFGNVSFSDYWNRVVLIDKLGSEFSREKIIRTVADQDGGAHVDPTIDAKYNDLIKNNSMGWMIKTHEEEKNLDGVELATVRQIGHEILRTLQPQIHEKKMNKGDSIMIVGNCILRVGKKEK